MAQQPSMYTDVSDVGEFGLIAHLRDTLGPDVPDDVLTGIGDDAAVIRQPDGRVQAYTTDSLIEGVHFDRTFMPMEHLGFKLISVNVSDLAAMNVSPEYALITIAIPKNITVEHLRTLYEGVKKACDAYGMTVVGGDTTSAHALTLSVTAWGSAEAEAVVQRSGAQVGDAICVTGDLGASYAGLKILADERKRLEDEGDDFEPAVDAFPYVIRRHLAPPAQEASVRRWRNAGFRPTSLIDISDGLSSEVHHICEASGVGARLFAPALPVHPETRSVADHFGEDVDVYAFFGGEDYELLFTADESDLDVLDETTYTIIGEITDASKGVLVEQGDGTAIPMQPGGFDHFDEGDDGA
ncbi:MAG: thiamine-phosphate kinase, partial [Longimonas sp.]|uniref:thiamine-phosphate kinase n=1 Tax=Longimonas sp. TaxID=2039626 RepID=UPI003974C778